VSGIAGSIPDEVIGYLNLSSQISNVGMFKNFHLSMSSRSALGFTQPPIQRISDVFFPGSKAAGSIHLQLSAEVKKTYINTCLHGVVLS
jgi:hypothetical protein